MRILATIVLLAAVVAAQKSSSLPPDIDPESYSRLPLMKRDQLGGEALRVYDLIAGKDQQGNPRATPPLGPAATSLASRGVAIPMDDLNKYIRNITPGTAMYHLCAIIAAREFDEPYEWNSHEQGALRAGVSQKGVDAVKYNRSLEGVPAKEALVIRFGRAIFQDRKVPSDLYADVVKEFGQQGMFELTAAMGDYAMAAIMLRAVDQHVPNATAELPPIKH
jgi:4-carboxymuconolactone decarboxylase